MALSNKDMALSNKTLLESIHHFIINTNSDKHHYTSSQATKRECVLKLKPDRCQPSDTDPNFATSDRDETFKSSLVQVRLQKVWYLILVIVVSATFRPIHVLVQAKPYHTQQYAAC